MALGLGLVLALELALRVAGVGDPRDRPDPFAGLANLAPLFPADPAEPGLHRSAAASHPTQRFAVPKTPGAFRVFVLGGSSVAGTPYGYEHAFAERLRQRLRAALPGRAIEVLNAGRPGFASRRLVYAAEEVAAYEPDLLVLYTGHNEVLAQRVYAHLADTPEAFFRLAQALRRVHLYVLLSDGVRALRGAAAPELDGSRPLVRGFGTPSAKETWQDVERQRFYADQAFRTNVERIVHTARGAGARVLLATQSKNTADWAVVTGRHGPEVDAAARARFAEALARADERRASDDAQGELAALREAVALDPGHAVGQQRLGDALRAAGDPDGARRAYTRAHATTLDQFGTTPGRNRAVRELAERHGTLFTDVEARFVAGSPGGLVGWNLFVDFLHPNLEGHARIADALAETLRAAGVPEPASAWQPVPPLADPAALYAERPEIRARELQLRIAAELVAGRREEARARLAELRAGWPGDPAIPVIEGWLADGMPGEHWHARLFGRLLGAAGTPIPPGEN